MVTNFQKMFSFLIQDLKILVSFLSVEDNKKICDCPMHCCPKRRSYIKTNSFICHIFYLKASLTWRWNSKCYLYFSDWKIIQNIYVLNQHWIGKHPMQCCPNRLIYIKTLSWELSLMIFFLKQNFRIQTSF